MILDVLDLRCVGLKPRPILEDLLGGGDVLVVEGLTVGLKSGPDGSPVVNVVKELLGDLTRLPGFGNDVPSLGFEIDFDLGESASKHADSCFVVVGRVDTDGCGSDRCKEDPLAPIEFFWPDDVGAIAIDENPRGAALGNQRVPLDEADCLKDDGSLIPFVGERASRLDVTIGSANIATEAIEHAFVKGGAEVPARRDVASDNVVIAQPPVVDEPFLDAGPVDVGNVPAAGAVVVVDRELAVDVFRNIVRAILDIENVGGAASLTNDLLPRFR